jgi:hypothetical protein
MITFKQYEDANLRDREELFKRLLIERDRMISFAKELLIEAHMPEKEALAQTFRKLHGSDGHRSTPTNPYESLR